MTMSLIGGGDVPHPTSSLELRAEAEAVEAEAGSDNDHDKAGGDMFGSDDWESDKD